MGQLTGTCFQRCAGLDAAGVLHSITYDIDQAYGTEYHQRYLKFLKRAQINNLIVGAGMTDPKGDHLTSVRATNPTPISSCTLPVAPMPAFTSPAPKRT